MNKFLNGYADKISGGEVSLKKIRLDQDVCTKFLAAQKEGFFDPNEYYQTTKAISKANQKPLYEVYRQKKLKRSRELDEALATPEPTIPVSPKPSLKGQSKYSTGYSVNRFENYEAIMTVYQHKLTDYDRQLS